MSAVRIVLLTCDACKTETQIDAQGVTAARVIANQNGWRYESMRDLCGTCS